MDSPTMEERVTALEAQVQALADIEEIRLLRMQYHEFINEGRSDLVPTLFAPEGTIDFGPMTRDLANLARASERLELMKQMIHNHFVKVDGDHGRGFAYQEGRAIIHGRGFVYCGRYDDTYVRTPQGWRFETMRFDPIIFARHDGNWADPSERRVDPHAGHMERDARGEIMVD